MVVRCLGAVCVAHGEEETRVSKAQRRILALLTAAGSDGLSSPVFAEELWANRPFPTDWESAVRVAISRLRRAVPPGSLVRRDGRYRLDLSVAEVDVWRLLELADSTATPSDREARSLLDGDAYPDLEPSPLLDDGARAVAAARIQLIERMVQAEHASWSTPTLHAAAALASRSPDSEALAVAAARLHRRAGRLQAARELTRSCITYVSNELGVEPGRQLRQFDDELRAGPELDGLPDEANALLQEQRTRVVGISGLDESVQALVDRSALREAILSSVPATGAVLCGSAGSGKTVLAQQVALQLSDLRHHIVWLRGSRQGQSAYAPFLAIDQAFHEELEPLLADGGAAIAQARCWAGVLDRLERLFPTHPVVIVADDAQWLDSHSTRLLQFIATAQQSRRVRLVVVGRDDPDAIAWPDDLDGFTRTGLTQHQVGDLTSSELATLAGRLHPSSSARQRADLATHLVEMRAATAALAVELVRYADEATLVLNTPLSANTESGIWATRVSPASAHIGGVAAVLGMRFSLDPLAAMSGQSTDEVLAAVDEMLDANLLEPEQRPDEFSFRHVLIHRAFETTLARGLQRTLHLQAAEGSDAHSRARHLVAARGAATTEATITALLESAATHQLTGSYREAVEAYRTADIHANGELDAQTLCAYADVLDAAGADGWAVRERSFAAALRSGHHDLCLTIASSSALETEDVMGDERRLAMLKAIEPDQLSRERRLVLEACLARNLGLLGQHDQAFELMQTAILRAQTPDESFATWMGAWPSIMTLPVHDWPPLPADSNKAIDPEYRSRLAQVRCVRSLLAGDDGAARRSLADFQNEPFTSTNGLRSWFATLMESTLAVIDGEFDLADAKADAALELGQAHGVTAAFSARAAQLFARHWLMGTHGDLLPLLDMAAPDVANSVLAAAGHAAAMATTTRGKEAAELANAISQSIVADRSPVAVEAAALLVSSRDAALVDEHLYDLKMMLEPFLGTHLLAGAGIASLGPASRALADVAAIEQDADRRAQLLQQAVQEADDWNLLAWRVRCRMDLASHTNDEALRKQAAALANGTDLEQLVS